MLELLSFTIPSINQILIAVGILVGAWLVSMIVLTALKHSKKLTSFTESTLDDEVIRLLGRPVHVGFQFMGIVLALWYLFPTLAFNGFSYGQLIPILIIVWIVFVIDRMVRGVMNWYQSETVEHDDDQPKRGTFGFLNTLISLLVWGLGFAFVLNQLGVDITALIAGLGIAGIAVALALQNTLSGLFSAVSLAVDKPVRLGDYVLLDNGTEGFVEDISMRSTRIRTFSQHLVIVPNSKLSEMVITNTFLPIKASATSVVVGISYTADLEKVEEIALKVANTVIDAHDARGEDDPSVRWSAFGDSAIEMKVHLRVGDYLDQFIVKSDFIKALKAAFEKEGIEIPFPQMDVHLDK
jgi:small-conductance mechanosensitive channel